MICTTPLTIRTLPRTSLAGTLDTAGTTIATMPATISTAPIRTSQNHLSRNTSAACRRASGPVYRMLISGLPLDLFAAR